MQRAIGLLTALLLGVTLFATSAMADDSVRPDQVTATPQRESGARSGMTQAGTR